MVKTEIRFWDFVFNRGCIRDYELLIDEQEKALIEFEEKVGTLTDEIDGLNGRLENLNIRIVTREEKVDEQSTDAE